MFDRWYLLPSLTRMPLAGCDLGFWFCWWPLGLWGRRWPPRRLLGTEAVFGEQHCHLNVDKIERLEEKNGPGTNIAVEGKSEKSIIPVLSKRLNVFTKKKTAIERLEQLEKEGKILNIEERAKVETKGNVAAVIKELELNINLVLKAIAQNSEDPSSSAAAEESGLMHKINDTTASENEVVHTTEGCTADGSELVHNLNPAKNIEAGTSSASYLPIAEGESRENIEDFCYTFLKEFTVQGDTKAFYDGEAMSLVGRGCLCIQYSHLCKQDKRLAMKICNDYEWLKPTIIRAAKRFATEVLEATIKALPPKEAHALKVKLEDLNLILVGKPMRHEVLTEFLQPPKELSLPVEVHSHNNNPMYTPASIGSSLLTDILEDVVSKHLEGLSYNGNFGTDNVEVYDGSRYVISTPLCKYALGSQELAEAAAKDFNSCAESIIPLFQIDNKFPPYMSELQATLSSVPCHVLQDKAELKAFHKFILDHLASKPPPVRAAFICALHNACKSYARKDHPDAPFKASISECLVEKAALGFWTMVIKRSGNAFLNRLLRSSTPNDYATMTNYLRILHEHGSDYTKGKKKKNKNKKKTVDQSQQANNNPQQTAQNEQLNSSWHRNQNLQTFQSQQTGQNLQVGSNQKQTSQHQQMNRIWHGNQNKQWHLSQQTGLNQQLINNQQKTGQNQHVSNTNWHGNQDRQRYRSQKPGQNQRVHNNLQQTGQNQNASSSSKLGEQTGLNQQVINNQQKTGQNQHVSNTNWHGNQDQQRHRSQQPGQNQRVYNNLQQTGQNQNAISSSKLGDEHQVQHLKVLDELEMLGAHYLAPFVAEMIYSLLKDDAMKGMLEPIWRAYRSGKILSEGESMVDVHRPSSCAPVN
ncbi:uncharacterized protein LOC123400089 isoform X2 [Hordeum vulgare subsp. vulgare]|uniref:uncharacterized protein LOC123400089 isoform X2 n=1 Tax=Hordeum vulgare subsp. vulgare TaxID=112509 RepID=UPI000B467F92|nr:uncharacterized protein LOC123400089 isoform X2 [Hordeum vulgare subsp. vulgare]